MPAPACVFPPEELVLSFILVRDWFRNERLEKTADALKKELHAWLEASYDAEVAANFPWDLFSVDDMAKDARTGRRVATLRDMLAGAAPLKASTESSSPSSTASTTDDNASDEKSTSDEQSRLTTLVWDLLNNESAMKNALSAVEKKTTLKRKAGTESESSSPVPPAAPTFASTVKRWRKEKHEPLQKYLEAAASAAPATTATKTSLVFEVRNFIERQIKSLEKRDEDQEPEWQPKPEFLPPAKKTKKSDEPKPDAIECREQNRRQDWNKWQATLEGKDERLRNGFHRTGDSWGDKAFAAMSVVKGKAFVKEMQKKKKASWRGGGAIDMGVNSFFFSDSD